MSENDVVEKAKLAFTIAAQGREMLAAMEKPTSVSGYHAYARNYNEFLKSARAVLTIDPTIGGTVQHLRPFDTNKASGYGVEHQQIQADLTILLSALHSFIAFHMPSKEKEQIGFK